MYGARKTGIKFSTSDKLNWKDYCLIYSKNNASRQSKSDFRKNQIEKFKKKTQVM